MSIPARAGTAYGTCGRRLRRDPREHDAKPLMVVRQQSPHPYHFSASRFDVTALGSLQNQVRSHAVRILRRRSPIPASGTDPRDG